MMVVVGGDDLLTGALIKLVNLVDLQMLRLFQHFADHFTQTGTATGGGEQQGLAVGIAQLGQPLHIIGEPHVEHAVSFVEHQHLNFIEQQIAGVSVFNKATRRADQNVHTAQHGRLYFEVLTTGDQPGLEEGELGKPLDFLKGLLRQLTGRQQDHRANTHARRRSAIAKQAIEHRQYESRRFAATGLRGNPQVFALQRQRNGR